MNGRPYRDPSKFFDGCGTMLITLFCAMVAVILFADFLSWTFTEPCLRTFPVQVEEPYGEGRITVTKDKCFMWGPSPWARLFLPAIPPPAHGEE